MNIYEPIFSNFIENHWKTRFDFTRRFFFCLNYTSKTSNSYQPDWQLLMSKFVYKYRFDAFIVFSQLQKSAVKRHSSSKNFQGHHEEWEQKNSKKCLNLKLKFSVGVILFPLFNIFRVFAAVLEDNPCKILPFPGTGQAWKFQTFPACRIFSTQQVSLVIREVAQHIYPVSVIYHLNVNVLLPTISTQQIICVTILKTSIASIALILEYTDLEIPRAAHDGLCVLMASYYHKNVDPELFLTYELERAISLKKWTVLSTLVDRFEI